MATTHRTSRGEVVDMDMLRLSNENVIAVGNMKTNARGDELGPGGKVVKTRAQVMAEYHKLNTPVANDMPVATSRKQAADHDNENAVPVKKLATPTVKDIPVGTTSAAAEYVKPRGSLAEAVAGETEVTQELLEPTTTRSKDAGVSRI
jgi:hypothetical protein